MLTKVTIYATEKTQTRSILFFFLPPSLPASFLFRPSSLQSIFAYESQKVHIKLADPKPRHPKDAPNVSSHLIQIKASKIGKETKTSIPLSLPLPLHIYLYLYINLYLYSCLYHYFSHYKGRQNWDGRDMWIWTSVSWPEFLQEDEPY